MRTYDERLNNIRAKASANQRAKRILAASAVVLSVFVLLIGSVILWPELLFGARKEPTMGPVLQQPSLNDTPTVNTTPSQPNEVEPTLTPPTVPAPTEPIPTSPTVPAPTEPVWQEPTEPASVGYMLLPMMPTDRAVDVRRIDDLFMLSGCYSNYKEIKKNCPEILSYLINVTPSILEGKCEIFRFTYCVTNGLAGETFIIYNDEVYTLGCAFGGDGITEFAYINDGQQDKLYFIYSWGSGLHRSHIAVFDFATKQETSLSIQMDDVAFELSEDGTKLGVCKAMISFGTAWDSIGVQIEKGNALYEDVTMLYATIDPQIIPFDPNQLLSQISADMQMQICQEYINLYYADCDWVDVTDMSLRVFGIFGDSVALFVDGFPHSEVITAEIVCGLEFWYPSTQTLYIYSNGKFCTLRDACDAQIVTYDDILLIYTNYKSAYPFFYE